MSTHRERGSTACNQCKNISEQRVKYPTVLISRVVATKLGRSKMHWLMNLVDWQGSSSQKSQTHPAETNEVRSAFVWVKARLLS